VIRRLVSNQYIQSLGTIALATAIGVLLRPYLQVTDLAMLLLLGVVAVAYRLPRGAALLACVASIGCFDFWFVPPYYTLDVHDARYFVTFGVMLLVALAMSQLTATIRDQAEEAREREQRTGAVFELSQEQGQAEDLASQIAIARRHLERAGAGPASVVLVEPESETGSETWPDDDDLFDSVAVRVAASWAYRNGESAGWGTSHCAESEALVVPLRSSNRTLGVVAVRPEPAEHPQPATRRTIEALAAQAAGTFERTMLAEGHQQARVEVESERLRTALLSSLSHDLRSPLGSIEGAASSLLEDGGSWQAESRREMAETILLESRRMSRLITNLLEMVRVESGALAVHKAWQPLEETLGVALLRVEERLGVHRVNAELPATLPLVPIDELLMEQVFINLLENAAKHTPAGTTVSISAWTEDGAVVVQVADDGPGIPPGEEETIFRKFHRGAREEGLGPAGGSGLGLTICRGIVTAHGGRLWLHRSEGRGAAFRFTLPLVGPPLSLMPPGHAETVGQLPHA
jgi:two-component system, OmpR family, sensor histidine kinase KdpD